MVSHRVLRRAIVTKPTTPPIVKRKSTSRRPLSDDEYRIQMRRKIVTQLSLSWLFTPLSLAGKMQKALQPSRPRYPAPLSQLSATRGRHSPIHEGTWCGVKIGILHPSVETTHFPVETNGDKGRFELLSASRIQRNSQIQLLIKNEKVRLDNLSIGASAGEIVVTEVCGSG